MPYNDIIRQRAYTSCSSNLHISLMQNQQAFHYICQCPYWLVISNPQSKEKCLTALFQHTSSCICSWLVSTNHRITYTAPFVNKKIFVFFISFAASYYLPLAFICMIQFINVSKVSFTFPQLQWLQAFSLSVNRRKVRERTFLRALISSPTIV